jgi:diguanylate cyclase (GGDEF)-like protein
VRPADTFARVGGEEFALLLPESDAEGAFVVCERVRARVRDMFARDESPGDGIEGMEPPLTVSLGVASFPIDGTHQTELMGAADRALYEAKRRGRDRTITRTMLDVS